MLFKGIIILAFVNSSYVFVKNTNPLWTIAVRRNSRFCLATTGVRVFSALTSVGALFVYKGIKKMNSIEKKLLNTESIEKEIGDGIVIDDDEVLKNLRGQMRAYLPYDKSYLLDDFFNHVNEIYKKQTVKYYEQGLLDGIRLSYEIKEK